MPSPIGRTIAVMTLGPRSGSVGPMLSVYLCSVYCVKSGGGRAREGFGVSGELRVRMTLEESVVDVCASILKTLGVKREKWGKGENSMRSAAMGSKNPTWKHLRTEGGENLGMPSASMCTAPEIGRSLASSLECELILVKGQGKNHKSRTEPYSMVL